MFDFLDKHDRWLYTKIYRVTLFNYAFGFLKRDPTECVIDLDPQSKMIIFESLLTTFELSISFRGSWESSENQLEPKTLSP